MNEVIPAGSWLGVLGGGQLGRMFVEAARRLGYRAAVYTDHPDSSAALVADRTVVGPYDDIERVEEFARGVEAITFEFENIPAEAVRRTARVRPARPAAELLEIARNRIREKRFLRAKGLATAEFEAVATAGELGAAVARLGRPCVFKTATSGYDGRGQILIRDRIDLSAAVGRLHQGAGVVEAWVDFETELSVVAARGRDGRCELYGPIQNDHRDHVLDVSAMPVRFAESVVDEARGVARALADEVGLEGVLCVEFFLTRGGKLLVNELAPRPHNSGHLTIEACETSQFEQQVRALAGLPLGSARLKRPAAMVNLLGDLWPLSDEGIRCVEALPDVHLHLYGKSHPRPRRKMGHLVALADSAEQARRNATRARASLGAEAAAAPTPALAAMGL